MSVFRVSRETFIIYGEKSTADVAMGFLYHEAVFFDVLIHYPL